MRISNSVAVAGLFVTYAMVVVFLVVVNRNPEKASSIILIWGACLIVLGLFGDPILKLVKKFRAQLKK